MTSVRCEIENRIAILTIDNPPVNALSVGVQERLRDVMRAVVADASVDAVVLIGAGNTFAAGADIRELKRVAREGQSRSLLPEVLMEIEASAKPVVAAIRGAAFGGGLETALAAHYRIADRDARVGQPEVQLGIIPGAGGTQRLPRLAGVRTALDMCVFGAPVGATEAMRFGIVDRIADGDLREAAIAFAKEAVVLGPRPTQDRNDKLGTDPADGSLFESYREKVRQRRPQRAPLAAVDAIERATTRSFEDGCRAERTAFKELLASPEARALIHVFLAERAASKVPGIDRNSETQPVESAAVVGAGTMGRSIAMCFADAGLPVRLKDTSREALDRALNAIGGVYRRSVEKGRMTEDEAESRRARIQPQLDYTGFDEVDIVVEAVFEDLEVKREVIGELGSVASSAILATNTSYLDVDRIAEVFPSPSNVIGLHFFSPANVMRLVEVIPGKRTRDEVTATALRLAKRLGKWAIVAGNLPGFIGNRMLGVYRREAMWLLVEGATPEQVDRTLEDWGMAMGPFQVQDLAGIDIAMSSRPAFETLDPPGLRQPGVMELLFAAGRLGQKTGAGWYRYDQSGTAIPDPEVDRMIDQAAREAGVTRRSVSADEIVERTVFALINEGARLLEDGGALRASDIDLVYIHGYGFRRNRGGPMHYADEVGLGTVRDRIREFHAVHPDRWPISPMLERLADEGDSFDAWDGRRSGRDSEGE